MPKSIKNLMVYHRREKIVLIIEIRCNCATGSNPNFHSFKYGQIYPTKFLLMKIA